MKTLHKFLKLQNPDAFTLKFISFLKQFADTKELQEETFGNYCIYSCRKHVPEFYKRSLGWRGKRCKFIRASVCQNSEKIEAI